MNGGLSLIGANAAIKKKGRLKPTPNTDLAPGKRIRYRVFQYRQVEIGMTKTVIPRQKTAEFTALQARKFTRWKKLIEERGIKAG